MRAINIFNFKVSRQKQNQETGKPYFAKPDHSQYSIESNHQAGGLRKSSSTQRALLERQRTHQNRRPRPADLTQSPRSIQ